MSRIRKWLHDYFGWHAPGNAIGFDGCSYTSNCRLCGRHILQDSHGGWFLSGRN